MRILTLDLDALTVESFATAATEAVTVGTANAFAPTYPHPSCGCTWTL